MAGKKGWLEYSKWQKGKSLTRKDAMLANCYVCNGFETGGVDCKGKDCPLYEYFPYRSN